MKILGLCEGRHELPVEGYIFGNQLDPLDLEGMAKQVHEKLSDCSDLTLYVTGLTVALGEVIAYCFANDIELTLMHFDRNSNSYYPQKITEYQLCPFCGTRNSNNSWYCKSCGAS